ncbi:hypothetical protein RDV89_17070 [Nocardioides zeae]|uniref:Glycosyltransferase RgtA/B/C/D-like domain-containing protein n=1 Tax=Nocardioides imazamoxiresistens TaxID=3231893 RepID=A0ABU3PZW1_9ACTN|nr:hypothetical protein [Nocardioides zeae]MDT9594802.1 hypothetical protein [Nocardioides zeae]
MRPLSRLAGADRVLVVLALVHLVVLGWAFWLVGASPLHGDEAAYVDGGRALSNLLRDLGSLRAPDVAELSRSVVASGWFMPGVPILLAPFFLVVPDGDVEAVRAYLGLVSTIVLALLVWRARTVLGPRYAAALLVMPGLVPMAAAFAFAAWGDYLGGLVLGLLVVELVAVSRRVRAGAAPSLAQGVRLGLLAVAVVYLRSSAALVVVGLGVVAVVVCVALLRGSARVRSLGAAAAALGAFLLVLAPWSGAASAALDGRVVTTTSVPTVLASTFGDQDRICRGPCDPDSTRWFAPQRYARETAAATGRSELDVLTEMSAYAREDVTPRSYSRDVIQNAWSYVKAPDRFLRWLEAPDDAAGLTARYLSRGLVWVAFGVGAAVLLVVVRGARDLQVLATLLTLSLGALMSQPFVHVSGPRYWTTAAPLLGLGGAMLLTWWQGRRGDGPPGGAVVADPVTAAPSDPVLAGRDAAFGTWLTRVQVLLAAGTVALALGIGAVAVLG